MRELNLQGYYDGVKCDKDVQEHGEWNRGEGGAEQILCKDKTEWV